MRNARDVLYSGLAIAALTLVFSWLLADVLTPPFRGTACAQRDCVHDARWVRLLPNL